MNLQNLVYIKDEHGHQLKMLINLLLKSAELIILMLFIYFEQILHFFYMYCQK